MTASARATSPLAQARLAGFLALIVLVCGTFWGSVSGSLIVPGDAAATAGNILASESLFRLGFVSGLTMYVVFIFYVAALYRLLSPVDRDHARVMLILGLIGVPIAMLNQINQSAALLILNGADYLNVLPPEQLYAQMMFFLELHKHGGIIGAIFWGLWLFPLGWLVYSSGCFPRVLGVFLMVGCFGWLLVFFQRFLFPEFEALAQARFAAHIAELLWVLWLLFKGVDAEAWKRLDSVSA